MISKTKPSFTILALASLAMTAPAAAQTKGQLGYNGDKDAGYLILNGRNDNRAARLSVDGSDNLRGFLELHRNGSRRFYAYVDSDGEGGLTLSSPGGEAANLYVDNSSDSGALLLKQGSGQSRVRLFVDDEGQGQLRLEGSGNSDRVSLYVDSQDQGGLSLYDDDNDLIANLYIDDDSDTGVLVLKADNGDTRAFLRVTDSGRGLLSLDDDNNVEKVEVYVDGADQGGLRLRGASGSDGAVLFVGDSTDAGVLRLMRNGGGTRSELSVNGDGRGRLILDGSNGSQRASLFVDDQDQGVLILRGPSGERVGLGIGDTTDAGILNIRNGSGEQTIQLDGETGTVVRSGVSGFLIDHPTQGATQLFYAALDGPEAGLYVRGSGVLSDGEAVISLPNHFASLARPETVTVQITATDKQTRGMAVTAKSTGSFTVEELGNQNQFGEASFDWLVMAERGDIPPLQVVRSDFKISLQSEFKGLIALDQVTVATGGLPIIEPKSDIPVQLSKERIERLRIGDIVQHQITLRPDISTGTVVPLDPKLKPTMLNPEPGRFETILKQPKLITPKVLENIERVE